MRAVRILGWGMLSADPPEPTSSRFSVKAEQISGCRQCLDRAGRKLEQEEGGDLAERRSVEAWG